MTPAHVETAAPEASDFFFGTVLGQGSYAKVFHAQMKTSRADFAVKVMDQSFIRKENKTSFVLTERKVMSRLAHPNVVKFYCSFRDHHSLYLVMELCRGGDLFGLISNEYQKHQQEGTTDAACSLELTQFYTAELTNALEYIHMQRVIHRDIKPDNLLLSAEGHLKVTDFGTAKDQDGENSDVCQFCGTASYVSPEVLHDEPASRAADLWAMGCLIFQMFTGRAPFVAENDYLTFQVIINHSSDDFEFPSSVPEVAQDLIRKLLVQNPDERIGAAQNEAGYAALKNHAFFEGIEWDAIRNQTPPFSPPKLELSEPTLDGASDNWTVAEYFTGDFSERASTEFNSKRSRSNSSVQRNRPPCIGYSEQIRFESTVKIRSKMFSRTRDLYLTDAPRLVVASSWSGRCKREMFLTPETSVKEIDPHTFDVESVGLMPPTAEASVTDLLKRLRFHICHDVGRNLRHLLPSYQRLLSPNEGSSNLVHRELLDIRTKLLSCGPRALVLNVVGRMDQLVEHCLNLEEQQEKQQGGEGAVSISEVMRLLVALAGGNDGETFLLEDPMQVYATGKKRIGDCIRMSDVKMVQCANALFSKPPASLDENALFSQNLFNEFGNGISDQHTGLWCPGSSVLEDKGLLDMMPSQQRNRFFCLPGAPPAQNSIDSDLTQPRDSTSIKHVGCTIGLPPTNGVFFFDSTQEVHCGGLVQPTYWGSATETSSSYSDRSLDTAEPWIARTYAWEDLGDRTGLSEGYCRPSSCNGTWSLRDLEIPNEFAGTCYAGEKMLEIHEVDLVENLLRALSGIDSTILRRHFQSATFQLPGKHMLKLRNATVSSTLSVLEVFRKAGTVVMRLELLAIYYSQDPARGGKTLQAMGDALQVYLSTHRTLVESIAQDCLVSSKVVSVAKLLSKTRKMCRSLASIGHVFGCDNDVFWPLLQQGTFPRGVSLLDHLHHHVSSLRVEDATGHVRELVIWFLVKACSPLLAVLSDLISSGKVDQMTDPFDEFDVTTWSRRSLEKAIARGGDGLFSDELTSEAVQTLPAFLENIAPSIIHLCQIQALLQSVNAISSTHPLVNMQPLIFFSSSSKATEHAEEWQSVMNKTKLFRDDVGTPHAVSMESHKDISDVTLAAAAEFLEQSIDVEVRQSQRTSMPDEQMLEVKQGRFPFAQEKKANDARLVESASEADVDKEADVREVCLNSGIRNRSAIDPTNTAVEAHDETGACSRASSGDGDAMTSRMRSTDGGVWLASVKPNMVLENCSVNSADGGAQSESIPVNDEVNCAAVSAAEGVKMVLSDLAVDQTGNSPPEDLLLEDHVSEDHRQQNAGGEWDDKPSLNASEFMEKVAVNATRASLPQVHPFFSATVPQDDIEVLTRASSTEDTSGADFTSFSSIVSCCVEMPVRLVAHKLEQVAVSWFRDSLQVLEHLRWLRKLMFMSEGLCMDIFARDFLVGLTPTTRVNWGVEDRLSSALALAMIEGCVSTDAMARNFRYTSTPALSQLLSSLTMTPAVTRLLSEIELVYDVNWPLGFVITTRSLNDYKQVHQFLLHVRLISVEMKEAWGILRSIRQRKQLSLALERFCANAVYRMQVFLHAFHETFATKVIMTAWAELERLLQKATTLVDLRRCHEEYVSIAYHCCFLDTPAVEIRSAISAAFAAVWKLTTFLRGSERRMPGRASVETSLRALCDDLDTTLETLVGSLRNVTRNAEKNTREFSECLLLRVDFNQYYSTRTPVADSSCNSTSVAD